MKLKLLLVLIVVTCVGQVCGGEFLIASDSPLHTLFVIDC